MEMIEISALKQMPDDVKIISNFEVKNNNVPRIVFDAALLIGNNLKYIFSDDKNPIVQSEFYFFNGISINKKYYQEHRKETKAFILKVINNNTSSYFKLIDPELIDSSTLNAIANNKNIKTIYLGNEENKYSLSNEIYELFKKNEKKSIVTDLIDDSLKECFDPIISYNNNKKLINTYTYEYLQKNKTISITSVKNDEIENLKYINPEAEIFFSGDKYDNFLKAIKKIKENKQQNKIFINAVEKQFNNSKNYKNHLNNYILSHPEILEYKDINIAIDSLKNYPINEYFNYEKRLIELIRPAIGLSPMEKYLYAYNITKKFKEYKEYENDKKESRDLYRILDNEYIVCVGYSKLLIDLLNKLGIEAKEYSVTVDTGFDHVPNEEVVINEDIHTKATGHARIMVRLEDEQYNINGIYIADPTWDNNLEIDYYNHSLMTQEEYVGLRRYNYLYLNSYCIEETFFSKTIEEFYLKANIIMNCKYKKLSPKEQKDKASQTLIQLSFINDYLSKIEPLEPIFVEKIRLTYPQLDKFKYLFDLKTANLSELKRTIVEIMYELGENTINMFNNTVGLDRYKKAISTLYKMEGKTVEDLEETIKLNRERQEICFPLRKAIYPDGQTIIIQNFVNKFADNNQEQNSLKS